MLRVILTQELANKSEYFRVLLEDIGTNSIGDVIDVPIPDGIDLSILSNVIKEQRIVLDYSDIDDYIVLKEYFVFDHIVMNMTMRALKLWNNESFSDDPEILAYRTFDPVITLTNGNIIHDLFIPPNTDSLLLMSCRGIVNLHGSARTIVLHDVRITDDVFDIPPTCTRLIVMSNRQMLFVGSVDYMDISESSFGPIFHIPDGCDTFIAIGCNNLKLLTGSARVINITNSNVSNMFTIPHECTLFIEHYQDLVYIDNRPITAEPLVFESHNDYVKIGTYHVPSEILGKKLHNYDILREGWSNGTLQPPVLSGTAWNLFGSILVSDFFVITDTNIETYLDLTTVFTFNNIILELTTPQRVTSPQFETFLVTDSPVKTLSLPETIFKLHVNKCPNVTSVGNTTIEHIVIADSCNDVFRIPDGCKIMELHKCSLTTLEGHAESVSLIGCKKLQGPIVVHPECRQLKLIRCTHVNEVVDDRLNKTEDLVVPWFIRVHNTWFNAISHTVSELTAAKKVIHDLEVEHPDLDYQLLFKIIRTKARINITQDDYDIIGRAIEVMHALTKINLIVTDVDRDIYNTRVITKTIRLDGYKEHTLRLEGKCIAIHITESPAMKMIRCNKRYLNEISVDTPVTIRLN